MASQTRLLFVIMTVFSAALTLCSWVFLRGIGAREGGSLEDIAEDLRDALRYRSVLILGVAGFLIFVSYIAVISFSSDALSVFPYYMGTETIGIILSISGFVGIFTAIVAGFLTDRFGKQWVPIVGMIIIALALIILAWGHNL